MRVMFMFIEINILIFYFQPNKNMHHMPRRYRFGFLEYVLLGD